MTLTAYHFKPEDLEWAVLPAANFDACVGVTGIWREYFPQNA